MSVRIQTAIYGIKESVFGVTCLVPSDDIEEARYELTILTEERDAALALAERRAVALIALVGDEPPICDLTDNYPYAGCAYCYGPHYHSRYKKRLGTYRGEYGKEPPPEPGEDEYAPFTEHTEGCPWEAARIVLAALPPPATEGDPIIAAARALLAETMRPGSDTPFTAEMAALEDALRARDGEGAKNGD